MGFVFRAETLKLGELPILYRFYFGNLSLLAVQRFDILFGYHENICPGSGESRDPYLIAHNIHACRGILYQGSALL